MSVTSFWFLLVDAATKEAYKGTSVDYVSLPETNNVAQFRKAVKNTHPNKLSSVDAADLKVYKNLICLKGADGETHQGPLKEDFSINGLGKSINEALIVVVPFTGESRIWIPFVDIMQLLSSFKIHLQIALPIKKFKSDWIEKADNLPVATYNPSVKFFRLPEAIVSGTQILAEKDHLLYCRAEFNDQFNFLQENVLKEGAVGYILGPPGTGKSSTCLAFISTLDRHDWVVTWIHLSTIFSPTYVRYAKKSKSILAHPGEMIDQLKDVLYGVEPSKNHIVFVDGFKFSAPDKYEIQITCNDWVRENKENRRLVYVCSIFSRGKTNVMDDKVINVQEFFVYSWKLEDYKMAAANEEFFEEIKEKLDYV
jgi:hypothetical protein